MKTKYIFEYVWIDIGDNLRSKIKIIEKEHDSSCYSNNIVPPSLPIWSFDGSSTGQAEGHDSDVFIRPVRVYKNPFYKYKHIQFPAYLVICECLNKDMTPHVSNTRAICAETYAKCKENECWFGIEQEYFLFHRKRDSDNNQMPYKWYAHNDPEYGASNAHYCGVGGDRAFGRAISDKHLEYCLYADIEICGTNLEVCASQLEYQIGPSSPLRLSDDLIASRYILHRITEEFDCFASIEPKPYTGLQDNGEEWNGSGGHCNFSDADCRAKNGLDAIHKLCGKFRQHYEYLLQFCGKNNTSRLTGKNETASMNSFSIGEGNRGASIRIPHEVLKYKCGYLEFRVPGANVDPYLITHGIMSACYLL